MSEPITLTRRRVAAGSPRIASPPLTMTTTGSRDVTYHWDPAGRSRSVARSTRAKIQRITHLRAAMVFQRRQERLESILAVVTAIQSTIALGIVAPTSDESMRLGGITIAGWVGVVTFVSNIVIAVLRALNVHFGYRALIQKHMESATSFNEFITRVYGLLVPEAVLPARSRAVEKDHESTLRRIEKASSREFPDVVRVQHTEMMEEFHTTTRSLTHERNSIASIVSSTPPADDGGSGVVATPPTRPPPARVGSDDDDDGGDDRKPSAPHTPASFAVAPAMGSIVDADDVSVDMGESKVAV